MQVIKLVASPTCYRNVIHTWCLGDNSGGLCLNCAPAPRDTPQLLGTIGLYKCGTEPSWDSRVVAVAESGHGY